MHSYACMLRKNPSFVMPYDEALRFYMLEINSIHLFINLIYSL